LAILAYDWFARRQNQLILRVAARSGAIVFSHFPAAIRRQLIEDYTEREYAEVKTDTQVEKCSNKKMLLSKPIAEFFPSTTVLFADLAGFTTWSSERQPQQVFMLLETIYRTFDNIAQSTGVYKVETIGDCYVAVTGLPDPQPDHAIVMAIFARECIDQMQKLLPNLSNYFGPETLKLSLRVGMHSGSVTAGVLRGDKAQFQLFGETVAIASKMEQWGSPNGIHVSQATADLLSMGDKGPWLAANTLRDGEATYWVALKDQEYSSLNEIVFDNDSSSGSGCLKSCP
jgi:class 3 adenylate cyclase